MLWRGVLTLLLFVTVVRPTTNMMKSMGVRVAQKTYPTGDKKFAVMQAFPDVDIIILCENEKMSCAIKSVRFESAGLAGFTAEEADPFLMCDYFGGVSKGLKGEDEYEVPWHPHRGMDLCSYLKSGIGRHADSMGHRGTYKTPGMQWISAGSGIEHAEGGGTPAGETSEGFQIWVNVPSEQKMRDPRYGTVQPEAVPLLEPAQGVTCRLLAGSAGDQEGGFRSVQPLQMADWELSANLSHTHSVPAALDNCILYVYQGRGSINGEELTKNSVIRLDATDEAARDISFTAGPQGLMVMMFAGKRLNQPIAWHGPFVMTHQSEIQQVFREFQSGTFPPKRAPWNYRKWADFPEDMRKGSTHDEL